MSTQWVQIRSPAHHSPVFAAVGALAAEGTCLRLAERTHYGHLVGCVLHLRLVPRLLLVYVINSGELSLNIVSALRTSIMTSLAIHPLVTCTFLLLLLGFPFDFLQEFYAQGLQVILAERQCYFVVSSLEAQRERVELSKEEPHPLLGVDLILYDLALGFLFHAGLSQNPEADADYLGGSEPVDLFEVVAVVEVEVVEELELQVLPLFVLIDGSDLKAAGRHYLLLRELYLYWFLLLLRDLQIPHALHNILQQLALLLGSDTRVVVLLLHPLEVEDEFADPAEVELALGGRTGQIGNVLQDSWVVCAQVQQAEDAKKREEGVLAPVRVEQLQEGEDYLVSGLEGRVPVLAYAIVGPCGMVLVLISFSDGFENGHSKQLLHPLPCECVLDAEQGVHDLAYGKGYAYVAEDVPVLVAEPIEVLQHQSHHLLVELLVPAAVSDDVRNSLVLVAIVEDLSVQVHVQVGLAFEQGLLSFGLEVGLFGEEEADDFEGAGNAVDSDVGAHVVGVGREESLEGGVLLQVEVDEFRPELVGLEPLDKPRVQPAELVQQLEVLEHLHGAFADLVEAQHDLLEQLADGFILREGHQEGGVDLRDEYPDHLEEGELEGAADELVAVQAEDLQEVTVSIVQEALNGLHGEHRPEVQDADQEVGHCGQLASLLDHVLVVPAEVSPDPHLPHFAVEAHVPDDCVEGQVHLELQALGRLVEVVLVGAVGDVGDELLGHLYLAEGLEEVLGEGGLQEDLLLHEVVGVLLHQPHYGRVADFDSLGDDLAGLLPLVEQHVGVVAVFAARVPVPVIDPGVVELNPAVLALDDGVVVSALGAAHVHHEALEDVALRTRLVAVELLEVDVSGEGDGVVELDLGEGLEVEDQALEVYEEEGREAVEAVVLLDGFYLALAELAEVVADDLGLDEPGETVPEGVLALDFYCEDVEVFYALLLVVALLAVDDVDQLALEAGVDEFALVGVLEAELEAVQKLVEELVGVVLLLGVDGPAAVVEVVEAEALGNEEDALAEGELVDDELELAEEVDVVSGHFGGDDAAAEGLDHLELLEDGVDVADAAEVEDAHLLPAAVQRVAPEVGALHDGGQQAQAVLEVADAAAHRVEDLPHLLRQAALQHLLDAHDGLAADLGLGVVQLDFVEDLELAQQDLVGLCVVWTQQRSLLGYVLLVGVGDLPVEVFVLLSEEQLVEDKEVLVAVFIGGPLAAGDVDGVVLVFELRVDAREQVVEAVEDLPYGCLLVEDQLLENLDLEGRVGGARDVQHYRCCVFCDLLAALVPADADAQLAQLRNLLQDAGLDVLEL